MLNSVVRTAAGERGGASISTGYPDCVCAQSVQKQGDWLTETGRERRTKRKLAKSLPHFLRLLPPFSVENRSVLQKAGSFLPLLSDCVVLLFGYERNHLSDR